MLKETQRVIDPRLLVRQEQLATLKEEYAKSTKNLEKDEEELATTDRKLKNMIKDVERYHARKETENQLLIQEVCLPYMMYTEAKTKFDEIKRTRNVAQRQVAELTEANAPLQIQKESVVNVQSCIQ